MASGRQVDDTTDELLQVKQLVQKSLEKQGVLNHIRAQLRTAVFLALDEQEDDVGSLRANHKAAQVTKTPAGELALALVRDFLEFLDLRQTASVLIAEANLKDAGHMAPPRSVDRAKLEQGVGFQLDDSSPALIQIISRLQSFDDPSSLPEPPRPPAAVDLSSALAVDAGDGMDDVDDTPTPVFGSKRSGFGLGEEDEHKRGQQREEMGDRVEHERRSPAHAGTTGGDKALGQPQMLRGAPDTDDESGDESDFDGDLDLPDGTETNGDSLFMASRRLSSSAVGLGGGGSAQASDVAPSPPSPDALHTLRRPSRGLEPLPPVTSSRGGGAGGDPGSTRRLSGFGFAPTTDNTKDDDDYDFGSVKVAARDSVAEEEGAGPIARRAHATTGAATVRAWNDRHAAPESHSAPERHAGREEERDYEDEDFEDVESLSVSDDQEDDAPKKRQGSEAGSLEASVVDRSVHESDDDDGVIFESVRPPRREMW